MIPLELSAARLMAAKKRPYLSPAIFALTPIERKGLKTLACDTKWRLYYCPSVFKIWTIEELASIILHEVSHLLREHFDRCKEANAESKLWNIAADIEINDSLVAEGIIIPSELLRSFQFNLPVGKLAEEYYKLLKEQKEQKEQENQQNNQQAQNNDEQQNEQYGQDKQPSSNKSNENVSDDNQLAEDSCNNVDSEQAQENAGDSIGNNSLANADSSNSSNSLDNVESNNNQQNTSATSPEEGEDINNSNSSKSSSDNSSDNLSNGDVDDVNNVDEEMPLHPGQGSCGSCANGELEDYEEKDEKSGLSKSKIAEAKQKTAERIMQMGRGKVPGGWIRWAEDITKPKVDWRKQLGSLVRNTISYSSGAVDYSYQRPSRRQSAFSNIVIPGMRKPNIELAVVIDTSGSMSENAISQVLIEVEAILKISGQTSGVRVIACDSDVHFNKKVFKKSQVQALGGGGTDMCMGIESALKAKPRPQVIVVITDGDSPWPCKQPRNTQLIVALTEYTYQQAIPKWAKVILVDN